MTKKAAPAPSLAFEHGRVARSHGISKDDAPYAAETESLADWIEGFEYEEKNERG